MHIIMHSNAVTPYCSDLLVDVNEGGSPTSSPPPPEPAIARIISFDEVWDADEDKEDTALVSGSGSHPKSDDDQTSPSRQKPARPAPPKPSPRRSKTVKERPGLPPRPLERGDGGSSSPPPGLAGEAQSLLIIDSRQKSKSVRLVELYYNITYCIAGNIGSSQALELCIIIISQYRQT